ncbi:MAG: esterase-like activity of phytase family protein [Kofleriaceae bacterium]
MKLTLSLLLLIACRQHEGEHKAAVALPATPFDELEVKLPPGTSDLSLDDHGHLWSVAERDREIDEIVLREAPLGVTITPHLLDGVPDGVDTESLAWLGDGKFEIGTEGQHAATATVMHGELQPNGRITVTPDQAFTDDQLGVALSVNHGVEGLCGHGDDLIAAIESYATLPDGSRWSPIVRIHAGKVTMVQRVMLTSDRGKISALSCTFAADGTADVIAIERHYGVSRIITFTAPATPGDITPKVALDLWPIVRDRYHEKLNLEGIVKLADGRWVMVNDNQGAHVDGPTELFVFHPR